MFGLRKLKEWWNRPPSVAELRRRHRHDSHGTADWADETFDDFGHYNNGVFLGGLRTRSWHPRDDKGRPERGIEGKVTGIVYSRPETSTLICAPPGTGKGTTIIIPTLIDFYESVFIVDPKGENAAVTMRHRRDNLGHTVHVLNPWGMHGILSSRMNPLDLLDPEDINCVSNAVFLADLIMMPNPGVKDTFWDESAKAMLVGLLLYIIDREPQDDTLANLRRLVTLPDQEFAQIASKMAASEAFDGALAEAGGTILGMDPKTRSNVRATAQAHTAFLADPVIKRATDRSDFSFADLKNKRTTVYVIIPAEHLGTQGRWLRLMVGLALTAIERGETFQVRTLFMLDEFAALGRLQKVETGIATLRGYGVDFLLAVQDLNQLKNVYGAASETLLANCADKYFCRISDLNTARMVSAMLGNETIRVRSESASKSPKEPLPSKSESWSTMARPLKMPEELLREGPERGFLIRSGAPPIMLKPCPYYIVEGFLEVCDPNPFVAESAGRSTPMNEDADRG